MKGKHSKSVRPSPPASPSSTSQPTTSATTTSEPLSPSTTIVTDAPELVTTETSTEDLAVMEDITATTTMETITFASQDLGKEEIREPENVFGRAPGAETGPQGGNEIEVLNYDDEETRTVN